MGGKSKKWKLWRSSSGDLVSSWKGLKGNHRAASECSDSPPVADAFSAAVATVLRAPPKDFRAVREEWAAMRIQTAFRGFLVNGFLCFWHRQPIFLFAEKMKEKERVEYMR